VDDYHEDVAPNIAIKGLCGCSGDVSG